MLAAYDYIPAADARRLAFFSLMALLITCVLSQLSIKTSGRVWSFSFVPTAVILLWPTRSSPLLSLLGIFLLGLLHDALGSGPYGVWALLWTSMFLIIRPDLRLRSRNLFVQWGQYVLVILAIGAGHILIGKFILSQAMAWDNIVLSSVMALAIFPLVWIVRELAGQSLVNRYDNFGREV